MTVYNQSKSYLEHMLYGNMNFGIEFTNGWLLARARMNELVPYYYDRWSALGAAAGQVWAIPLDANSLAPLQNKDYDDIMHQTFLGINQPRLRVFQRIPNGQPRRGLRDDIGNPDVAAASASTFGWQFEGWESPTHMPTGRSMFFTPKSVDVDYAFWNPELFQVQPLGMFWINKLQFTAYNPENKDHLSIILGIFKGKIPALLWSPGVLKYAFGRFKEIFKVKPIQWDGVKATVEGKELRG